MSENSATLEARVVEEYKMHWLESTGEYEEDFDEDYVPPLLSLEQHMTENMRNISDEYYVIKPLRVV